VLAVAALKAAEVAADAVKAAEADEEEPEPKPNPVDHVWVELAS